jgi:hypothetical protein
MLKNKGLTFLKLSKINHFTGRNRWRLLIFEFYRTTIKNNYAGKTGDTTCTSTLRGASCARSEVEILEDKIISWDRGFDAKGNYVWGVKKGGYIFNKLD